MVEKDGAPARPTGPAFAVAKVPLLGPDGARALMRLFKTFANDTRLRLLHALVREGELCVTDLANCVGMKPQAVSNQLQRMVDRGILGARRDGTNIRYRVLDPCVPVLLEHGMCLVECCPESGSRRDGRGRGPSIQGSRKGGRR